MHQSGDIINQRYRVTEVLGKGSVGVTYSAIDISMDSVVAIKAVSLKQLNNWKQVELLTREAEVLASLDHPNIPQYLDYFNLENERDKVFYIVQQLAKGKSLFQLIESGWRITELQVKSIAEQILAILDYLHSLKPPVIHRDLKPQNLIYSNEGKVFLVDFGAVQHTYYNTLMQGSTVVGTYGYMSPEQFRGKAFPATDLYSLGATLLYLLTHRSPAELAQNSLKIQFKSQVNISEQFANWLDKLIEPDPQDRFSSAKKALAALKPKRLQSNSSLDNKKSPIKLLLFPILLGLGLGVHFHKWAILSSIGYYPVDVCSKPNSATKYIRYGGKTNIIVLNEAALFNQRITETQMPLLRCSSMMGNQKVLDLLKSNIVGNNRSQEEEQYYNELLLFSAIFNRDTVTIEKLLNRSSVNIQAKYYGENRLNSISKRFDNFELKSGFTPLHIAAIIGDEEVVQLLIEYGADVNATKIYNYSSQRVQHQPRRIYTIQYTEINTPLSEAVRAGNSKIVELLLANGADINKRFSRDRSILSLVGNDTRVARVLINNGADVNAIQKSGQYTRTPLSEAVYGQNFAVAKLLLESGADPHIKIVDNKSIIESPPPWMSDRFKDLLSNYSDK